MSCRFAHGDGRAAHFENFIEWNRRLTTCLDRPYRGRRAGVLALVLPPQPFRPEVRPPIRVQSAKIIELQNAAAAKYFDSFLGEGCVAARQVMNGSNRSIGKA